MAEALLFPEGRESVEKVLGIGTEEETGSSIREKRRRLEKDAESTTRRSESSWKGTGMDPNIGVRRITQR